MTDAYAFSKTSGPDKSTRLPESPPWVSKAVIDFIKATQPGKEQFWEQICDAAHPNGDRMMRLAGDLRDQLYERCVPGANEPQLFAAVFNCLYSCCWLIASDLDFDVLLEQIRCGEELPADHELRVRRNLINDASDGLVEKIGPARVGSAKAR